MIVYNEKVEDEASSSHHPPPPTSPRTPQSLVNAESPRPGLLHHYLQMHLNRPGTLRRSSAETAEDLQDQPPPYTASLSDFPNPKHDELSKLLPRSCPPIAYSAIHTANRHVPLHSSYAPPPTDAHAEQPIARPSTLPPFSPRMQTGDIEGTWTISSDHDDDCNPPAEHQAAVRSRNRTSNLITESGNVRASITVVEGSSQRRCKIEATTGLGSVDLNITRTPYSSPAKFHLITRSKAYGHISIALPPNFCGLVRIRRRGSSYLHPIQLNVPSTTFLSCQYSGTELGASTVEYFVGDVVAAGYVKGLTDEDWRGDIVEAEAREGAVTISTTSQVQQVGFVETLVTALSLVSAYLWTLCTARWWS